MNKEDIVKQVIPPSDYSHRNGFDNRLVIDKLTDDEKKLLEEGLVEKLGQHPKDTLIVDSLAYLGSKEAIPFIMELLKNCDDLSLRIFYTAAIFEINGDKSLITPTLSDFALLDNKNDSYYVYKLIDAFDDLIKFKDPVVNQYIQRYTTHKEYLVSYNAKKALENADF
jgi:hypothetical protein